MADRKRQSRPSKRQYQTDRGDRVEIKPNLMGALVLAGREGLFGKEYVELADSIWKAVLTLEEIAYRLQARTFLEAQKKSGVQMDNTPDSQGTG